MNKLMGFLELQNMNLPSVPWKEYKGNEELQEDLLWTVRSAVFRGNDLNLPRLVGADAIEAKEFADGLLQQMKDKGLVLFYPYFVANKSGTLEVRRNRIIIEAVKDDLWNMVTYSDRNVTIQYQNEKEEIDGDEKFLSEEEKHKILNAVKEIKRTFRDDLLEDKSVLLEWSFAQNCNKSKEPTGEEYIVFYEARTV